MLSRDGTRVRGASTPHVGEEEIVVPTVGGPISEHVTSRGIRGYACSRVGIGSVVSQIRGRRVREVIVDWTQKSCERFNAI
jgi:hypothetical protein